MRSISTVLFCILTALSLGPASSASAAARSGRAMDPNKATSLRLTFGRIHSLSGSVEETKRAGADAVTTEGRFLERYTFEDLGFDDSYNSIGLSLERSWKYVTLLGDVLYSRLEGGATARRVYAIGVDEVTYQGQSYEYMLIPSGRRFDAELDTLMIDFRAQITPFHFTSPRQAVRFSPWISLGIYALASDFSVDAGPATGVTTYEYDPHPYVVGGKASGTAGGLLPQVGVGGELRIQLAPMNEDHVELVLSGEFNFLDLVANTGDFGVNSRNEKEVDLEFTNVELRAQLELPISPGSDFLVGAGMKQVETNAEIEAQKVPPGRKTTEKYDKVVEMEIQSYYFFIGLKF